MGWALLAVGLVLVVEGLVWALVPNLVEQILSVLRGMGREERRLAGLGAVALGLACVWAARLTGTLP